MDREIKFSFLFQHERTGSICDKRFSLEQVINGTAGKLKLDGYNLIAKREYTGLKDKNGVEIYESDIIKSDNSIGKIIYNDCEFRINWVVNKNFFNDVIPRHNKWCEVIGNIYENPNLIPDSVEVF